MLNKFHYVITVKDLQCHYFVLTHLEVMKKFF